MQSMNRNHGFTLLEVLIALLIFTLGLLGMAGLLVVSVKTNHSAYLRSHASFLGESMADRMRGNLPGVWADAYDTTYPTADTNPCASGGACTTAQIAARDRWMWSSQLTTFLPGAGATIACTPTAGSLVASGPYDGLCAMTITWREGSLSREAGPAPPLETFVWMFQP